MTRWILIGLTVLFFAFIFLAALGPRPAYSHSWYDPWCCNEKDCAPVTKSSYEKATGVWTMTTKHGTVTFKMTDTLPLHKVSQDGGIHVCLSKQTHPDFYTDARSKPFARCVYWPAM